jgi:hypothetical protein
MVLLACGGDPDPDAGPAAHADSMATVADTAAASPDTISPAAAEPGVSDPPAAPAPDPSPELDTPKISGPLRMALAAEPPPDSLLVLITSRPALDSDGLAALTSAFLRVRTARGEVATAMASPAALADLIRSDRILYIELSTPQPAAR